ICPQADCRWLNWQNDVINVERLREILAQNCDTLVAVSDIPNARTWGAVSAWRISNEKGDSGTVAELRKEIIQHPVPLIEPDDVAHLADEIGYSASMVWSAKSEPVFDVIFRKKGTPWTNPRVGPVEYAALDSYTNNPLRQAIVRQLVPELRQWLKKQLPDYMVPSTYMV